MECVEAESTGGTSHKVNSTESHFPEVAGVYIHWTGLLDLHIFGFYAWCVGLMDSYRLILHNLR